MSDKVQVTRRDVLKGAGLAAAGTAAAGLLPAKKAFAAENAPRWVMIYDLKRCVGCRACVVACKAEYDTPLGVWNTVIQEEVTGTYPQAVKHFVPRQCNHCEGNQEDQIPPCVKICPEYPKDRREFTGKDGSKIRYRGGATYKRPDGLILYDNELCIGCGKCIDACPYGARAFNTSLIAGADSTKNGITKCSFCQHRIDQGVTPACVNICPGKARIFGDISDPESEVAKLAKQFGLLDNEKVVLLPAENTRPMLYYIDPRGALEKTAIAKKKYEQNEFFRDNFSETTL